MINSYDSFVNYFRTLVENYNPVSLDFIVGNSERILNRQQTEINYPAFWLEVPDLRPGGEHEATFSGAFLILQNAELDDWSAEDAALQETLVIVFDFLSRMADAAGEGTIEYDQNKTDILHKPRQTADNDWGWRVEFEITATGSLCVTPSKWNDL